MKYDMDLFYTTDTGVEVKIEAVIDGIIVHTKDGDFENRFRIAANDSVEIANMLAKASQHTRELNNKS